MTVVSQHSNSPLSTMDVSRRDPEVVVSARLSARGDKMTVVGCISIFTDAGQCHKPIACKTASHLSTKSWSPPPVSSMQRSLSSPAM